MRNLRDVSVELIRGLLGDRKALMPYSYPGEKEAYRYVRGNILSMSVARHKEKVGFYSRIRGMNDVVQSVSAIVGELGVSTRKVYKCLHMDVAKVLKEEQAKALKVARLMPQTIAAGCITTKNVARKMDGTLTSGIVRRSMRILSRHYTELRRQVREHNRKLPAAKPPRVKRSAIWHYIMTGRTSSGEQ